MKFTIKNLNHKKLWLDAMMGMTIGFIASLIVGTMVGLFAIGSMETYLSNVKYIMGFITGFAIGVGIGIKAKLQPLQVLAIGIATWICSQSTLVPSYLSHTFNWSGEIGINTNIHKPGDVFAAFLAGTMLLYLFSSVKWLTSFDIIAIPFLGVIIGIINSMYLTYLTSTILVLVEWIIDKTTYKTHVAGILLAPITGVLMGLALSLPTSSAAIALLLRLEGDAATAAMAGTAAQMVSFGLLTYMATKDVGKSMAVGFGSSMLQIHNYAKKPIILVIPTIASALAAFIAVLAVPLDFPVPAGNGVPTSGMGTSALYGQIFTLKENGWDNHMAWVNVLAIQLATPIAITYVLGQLAFNKNIYRKEWFKI